MLRGRLMRRVERRIMSLDYGGAGGLRYGCYDALLPYDDTRGRMIHTRATTYYRRRTGNGSETTIERDIHTLALLRYLV